MKGGQGVGVFKMLSFISFKYWTILHWIGNKGVIWCFTFSVTFLVISISLLLVTLLERENTCSNLQRLHCWRGACSENICQSLLMEQTRVYWAYTMCWPSSSYGPLHLTPLQQVLMFPNSCNFQKATKFSGTRSRKSSSDSMLLDIIIFYLVFLSEIKGQILHLPFSLPTSFGNKTLIIITTLHNKGKKTHTESQRVY